MDRRLFLVVALLAIVALVVPSVASAAELTGTVKSVKDMTAVVTDDKKMDHNVTWTKDTKVKGGEVKAGAHVKITHEGGKASAIEVLAAKK